MSLHLLRLATPRVSRLAAASSLANLNSCYGLHVPMRARQIIIGETSRNFSRPAIQPKSSQPLSDSDSYGDKSIRASSGPEGSDSKGVIYSSDEQNDKNKDVSSKPSLEQLELVKSTLVTCLPKLFFEPHPYSTLYTQDLLFIDNIRNVRTTTIAQYLMNISMLKILAHLRYQYVKLEVLRATTHPEDGTVRVRWRIIGRNSAFKIFFTPWKLNRQAEDWHDGFSVFHVRGSDTRVYQHVCDKVIPDDGEKATSKVKNTMGLALFSILSSPELGHLVTPGLSGLDPSSQMMTLAITSSGLV